MPLRHLLPLGALALLAACGPDSNLAPRNAGSVVLVSGSGQVAKGGQTLPNPVVVKVADSTGAPRAGVTVTWTPGIGSGSVTASTTTDASGQVSATWTIGTMVGTQRLTATVIGVGATTATALVPGFKAWTVAVGDGFACGLDALLAAWCWGSNAHGVFGDTTVASTGTPVVIPGGHTFSSIVAGADFACGLTDSVAAQAWCWGADDHGQRGVSGTPAPAPTLVSGGLTWTAIAAGGQTACGIAADSTAWCWGINGYGQVGDATSGTDRTAPVAVAGGLKFRRLAVSATHACGISVEGRLWCWGRNADRELGADSTATFYTRPVPVATTDTTGWTTVIAGGFHTCAVSVGITWCWGAGNQGQMGTGSVIATDVATPLAVDSTHAFVALGADSASTVGLGADGRAFWWGNRGSLTAPTTTDRSLVPRLVPTNKFSTIATGRSVSCGVSTSNGYVYCWGASADPNFPAADTPAGVPAP